MKKIEVTVGYREEYDNGEVKYYGGPTDNGWCYKDMDAFESGKGICYIGEYSLQDLENDGDALLWTRKMIIDEARETIERGYPEEMYSNEKFVVSLAEAALEICDWQEPSTYLDDLPYDDSIEELFNAQSHWDY